MSLKHTLHFFAAAAATASGQPVCETISCHHAMHEVLSAIEPGPVQQVTATLRADRAVVGVAIDGEQHTLDLRPHSVRSEACELRVHDKNDMRAHTLGPVRTYSGQIRGEPDSVVAGSVTDRGVHAVIRRADGSLYLIEPTNGPDATHTVTRIADGFSQLDPIDTAGLPLAECEIALDSDYELFHVYGNDDINDTVTYMETTLLISELIFRRDVAIVFRATWFNVWMTEPDPYYSFDSKDLLEGMQAYWNDNLSFVWRDTAHLLSGKILPGRPGAGNIGSVCQPSNAYAVSTGQPQHHLMQLVGSMVHEFGHVFGATHCDGDPDCFIMCGDPACYTGIMEFGSQARGQILDTRAFSPCLDWIGPRAEICPVDLSGDGNLNAVDFVTFQMLHTSGNSRADWTKDGLFTIADYVAFQQDFVQGCPDGPDLRLIDVEISDPVSLGCSSIVSGSILNDGDALAKGWVQIGSWLTLDGNPFDFNNDNIPMGGIFGLGHWIDLHPGDSAPFQYATFIVPDNAYVGPQKFVTIVDLGIEPCGAVCESNELNNTNIQTVQVVNDPCACLDLQVLSVDAPASFLGDEWIPVDVDIKYIGAQPATVPVDIWIGPSVTHTVWNLQPGESTITAWALTPLGFPDCGGPESVPVRAVASFADCNLANNEKMISRTLIDKYFDLQYKIIDADDCAKHGGYAHWTVRVWNTGNTTNWVDICSHTGIGLFANNFNQEFFYTTFDVGPIAPGEHKDYAFTAFVPYNAAVQTQWIKAGENIFGNCFIDVCGNNDFDNEPIEIMWPWMYCNP